MIKLRMKSVPTTAPRPPCRVIVAPSTEPKPRLRAAAPTPKVCP